MKIFFLTLVSAFTISNSFACYENYQTQTLTRNERLVNNENEGVVSKEMNVSTTAKPPTISNQYLNVYDPSVFSFNLINLELDKESLELIKHGMPMDFWLEVENSFTVEYSKGSWSEVTTAKQKLHIIIDFNESSQMWDSSNRMIHNNIFLHFKGNDVNTSIKLFLRAELEGNKLKFWLIREVDPSFGIDSYPNKENLNWLIVRTIKNRIAKVSYVKWEFNFLKTFKFTKWSIDFLYLLDEIDKIDINKWFNDEIKNLFKELKLDLNLFEYLFEFPSLKVEDIKKLSQIQKQDFIIEYQLKRTKNLANTDWVNDALDLAMNFNFYQAIDIYKIIGDKEFVIDTPVDEITKEEVKIRLASYGNLVDEQILDLTRDTFDSHYWHLTVNENYKDKYINSCLIKITNPIKDEEIENPIDPNIPSNEPPISEDLDQQDLQKSEVKNSWVIFAIVSFVLIVILIIFVAILKIISFIKKTNITHKENH